MSSKITYRGGYKYQLLKDYSLPLPLQPLKAIKTPFLRFSTDGVLTIRAGYAWDGPSGPAVDTADFMRASLVHDALYQLIREQRLEPNCRVVADEILWTLCLEDGMSYLRAWWVYRGVRLGGGSSADPAHEKPVLVAP